MRTVLRVLLAAALAAACGVGCSSSPPPGSPAVAAPSPAASGPFLTGAADSVGAIPGSENAKYIYRFRQTDPSSDRFTFQDRDLSFAFRPSPSALFIQVENRQDRPVWIEWDRSNFVDPFGTSRRIANADTRWSQRFGTVAPTQIAGLQRHSNYVLPIDYLVDPGGSSEQLHRPLFPEDQTAPQYVDREFGVTLMFRLEDRLQPYTFRFRVVSVLPR